ncbi:hypothetical protein REPUB_Repub06bG0041600 [Reevesia pubescens]
MKSRRRMQHESVIHTALSCDDILYNILVRLPPESISKLIIVSKRWLNLICSLGMAFIIEDSPHKDICYEVVRAKCQSRFMKSTPLLLKLSRPRPVHGVIPSVNVLQPNLYLLGFRVP